MDAVTLGLAQASAKRYADTIDARKTSALRPAYARLAMRDTQPFDWLVIGDSTSEGARNTNSQTRWVGRALKQLRARLGQTAAGGYGYVPAWYSTGDQQSPSPVTFVSTGSNTGSGQSRGGYGLGRRCLAMTGGTDKSVLTLVAGTPTASTAVDVIYAKTTNATSAIEVYLDGTLLTTITTSSGTPSAGNRYRISGLAGTSHTIEVRATGAVVYFEGFMLYNGDETSGIRLWDAAASGSTSAWHGLVASASRGTPNFVYTWDDWVAIQPSLVTIMLGINDYYDGTAQRQTPSQYGTNLAAIIANVRAACTTAPGIVLIPQWERGSVPTATSSANPWSSYLAAAAAVAAADPTVTVFDASKRFPPGVQTTALGLVHSDLTHITDIGAGFHADAFVNWFLPR